METYSGPLKTIGGPCDGASGGHCSNLPLGVMPHLAGAICAKNGWSRPLYDLRANGEFHWTGEWEFTPTTEIILP